jgi:HAD superfamily hydrolase (TIGR01509 family)
MTDGSGEFADRTAFGAADLEELAWRWRRTLDAAQGAVAAATRYLMPETVHRELAQLARERSSVADELDALARLHGLRVPVSHLSLPPADLRRLLGLPADVKTCVFDLDGVLVPSAALHAAAWKETFDEFVLARSERTHGQFALFEPRGDYYACLHGRPRLDGVRAFLASRGIRLAEGEPDDRPGLETVHGLANRKRDVLLRRLAVHRLDALAGSRYYLEVAREAGIRRVVVSASANTQRLLRAAAMDDLVDVCVDGTVMATEQLRAKPAPDTLLAACAKAGSDPRHAVAFETTDAGVAAARAAGFELVVAVEADSAARALRAEVPDRVVAGLTELLERPRVA